ncbi:hypothetical protein PMIN01_10622 [Paraphaeosphaeria minitans]|uniref:Uncharacterized protein n=1 Tax=Paraphaeosphaeria minitans TaxID=565426 RepID=A0A9P6KM65_9PLEO|nr:hypothetical protein PMIN01_10622 [Paraphaeosphaeria minitans]
MGLAAGASASPLAGTAATTLITFHCAPPALPLTPPRSRLPSLPSPYLPVPASSIAQPADADVERTRTLTSETPATCLPGRFDERPSLYVGQFLLTTDARPKQATPLPSTPRCTAQAPAAHLSSRRCSAQAPAVPLIETLLSLSPDLSPSAPARSSTLPSLAQLPTTPVAVPSLASSSTSTSTSTSTVSVAAPAVHNVAKNRINSIIPIPASLELVKNFKE